MDMIYQATKIKFHSQLLLKSKWKKMWENCCQCRQIYDFIELQKEPPHLDCSIKNKHFGDAMGASMDTSSITFSS